MQSDKTRHAMQKQSIQYRNTGEGYFGGLKRLARRRCSTARRRTAALVRVLACLLAHTAACLIIRMTADAASRCIDSPRAGLELPVQNLPACMHDCAGISV